MTEKEKDEYIAKLEETMMLVYNSLDEMADEISKLYDKLDRNVNLD